MKPKGRPEGSNSSKDNVRHNAEDTDHQEYKFNLGMYRIDLLAELLEVSAKKYMKALRKRDDKSLHGYKAIINTLYTETYIYMEDETNFQIKDVKISKKELLETKLDKFKKHSSEEERIRELKDVRQVYISIRKLLKEVGMDIPQKERIGETETFIK